MICKKTISKKYESKPCVKIKRRLYHLQYGKQYRLKNKAREKSRYTNWKLKNRDRINKQTAHRIKSDINFKLRKGISSRIAKAIKKSHHKTMPLLGCSIEFVRGYLEALFSEGMSWDNHGKWHIDHKLPCASFDLTKEEDQRKCFHYTNLQPLWANDNLSKGCKIVY